MANEGSALPTSSSDEQAEPHWLDAEEMSAWLPLMRVLHLLPQQLDRQLREQAGINHMYYMIMVGLSAQPDRSMTLSSLARAVGMVPSPAHPRSELAGDPGMGAAPAV